jgi:dihydropteroate synthase
MDVGPGTPERRGAVRESGFNCFVLALSPQERKPYLERLDAGREVVARLAGRMDGPGIQADGLDPRAAALLRQSMLAAGGDAAVPESVDRFAGKAVSVYLVGERDIFNRVPALIKDGPYGLNALGPEIEDCLRRASRPRRLVVRGDDLLASRRCLIMGILNLTPDSFSDGGRYLAPDKAVAHGLRMVEEGAHILDLGAESSRPGSEPVSAEEESDRLLPVLAALRASVPGTVISVDTTKSVVARKALEAGADMINDISSGRMDPAMMSLCAERKAPLVLMHMRGVPKTMQEEPFYRDPVGEVTEELRDRVFEAEAAGMGPGDLVVDPGIGFGKRPRDNTALIRHLEALSSLGYPVLVGVSRKSIIGFLTGAPVEERLPGTIALHTAALLKGASILRVHDVKAHVQALACAEALLA